MRKISRYFSFFSFSFAVQRNTLCKVFTARVVTERDKFYVKIFNSCETIDFENAAVRLFRRISIQGFRFGSIFSYAKLEEGVLNKEGPR